MGKILLGEHFVEKCLTLIKDKSNTKCGWKPIPSISMHKVCLALSKYLCYIQSVSLKNKMNYTHILLLNVATHWKVVESVA